MSVEYTGLTVKVITTDLTLLAVAEKTNARLTLCGNVKPHSGGRSQKNRATQSCAQVI